MPQRKGQFLVHWFRFLTFLCLLLITLQCCGGLTRGDSSALGISLDVPQGEDPALFWFGVQKKSLRVTPEKTEEAVEIPWETGGKSEIQLHEGDRIEFLGTDSSGRLLVTGETVVRDEKKVTIPLRRVL